jgi:4-amino-4-deoxy-L-arabinose transferase-like glycosyltransferase
MNRKNRTEISPSILYILFTALVVRALIPLIVILTRQDYILFYTPDSFSYVRLAKELVSHGRFWYNGAPEIFRTPGYPILLIPGIFLGHVEIVTIALQIVLSCMTAYVVFRISMLLFKDKRVALFGALMYAVEPVSVLYASKLLSETLCAFLTSLFTYCMIKYFKTESPKMLALASIILSASVYVRPVSYYLPIVITVVLLVWSLKRRKTLFVTQALGFLICSFLIIGLWQLRNYRETGYSGFSSVADYDLYCHHAASVLAIHEGIPYSKMQHSLGCPDKNIYLQRHPEQSQWDRGKIYRSMASEGMRIILGEPATYFLIHVKGMLRTLLDPGVSEYLILFKRYSWYGGLLDQILDRGLFVTIKDFANTMPFFFISMMIITGFYLIASLIALFHRDFPYDTATIVIFFILAYYLVVSGGPVGYHRFRLPIIPLISVFSGYGIHLAIGGFRQKNTS